MKKLVLLIAVLSFMISCNTEKKPAVFTEKVNKNNLEEITNKIKNDQTLEAEEVEIINRGITRLAVNGTDTLIGLSIGEIYEYQKDFLKEQANNIIDENMKKVALILNHEFKYIGLTPRKDTSNNQDYDFIVYEITNKGEKPIKNIFGVLQFYNQQNQLVKQYPLKSDVGLKGELIEPNKTKRIVLPYYHDKKNIRDSIMRSTRLRTIWQPRSIIFADDTKISVDEN